MCAVFCRVYYKRVLLILLTLLLRRLGRGSRVAGPLWSLVQIRSSLLRQVAEGFGEVNPSILQAVSPGQHNVLPGSRIERQDRGEGRRAY